MSQVRRAFWPHTGLCLGAGAWVQVWYPRTWGWLQLGWSTAVSSLGSSPSDWSPSVLGWNKTREQRSAWERGLRSSVSRVTHPLLLKARQPATGRPSRVRRRSDGPGFLTVHMAGPQTYTSLKEKPLKFTYQKYGKIPTEFKDTITFSGTALFSLECYPWPFRLLISVVRVRPEFCSQSPVGSFVLQNTRCWGKDSGEWIFMTNCSCIIKKFLKPRSERIKSKLLSHWNLPDAPFNKGKERTKQNTCSMPRTLYF